MSPRISAGRDGIPLARESESYYIFNGSELETPEEGLAGARPRISQRRILQHAGLGALYSRASSYIFGDWNKCGELMGLAPYGRPDQIKSLMEIKGGELHVPDWTASQPALPARQRKKWETSPSMQHWKDLAWRVQDDTEKVLLARARWLREKTGAKILCIAGGVALNCVANGRIAREAGFENVWIQPAAGDDGIAIGCAYYGQLAIRRSRASSSSNTPISAGATPTRRSRRRTKNRSCAASTPRAATISAATPRRSRRRQCHRLVPGPLRVRPARARQPQHHRRSAQARNEGHSEQARETPPGVPAVRADRARRT